MTGQICAGLRQTLTTYAEMQRMDPEIDVRALKKLGRLAAKGKLEAECTRLSASAPTEQAQLDLARPGGDDLEALARALELWSSGDLAAARRILERLHRDLPANQIVLHELALAYRVEEQPSRAAALLAQ